MPSLHDINHHPLHPNHLVTWTLSRQYRLPSFAPQEKCVLRVGVTHMLE